MIDGLVQENLTNLFSGNDRVWAKMVFDNIIELGTLPGVKSGLPTPEQVGMQQP